jgi:hypothetical protein
MTPKIIGIIFGILVVGIFTWRFNFGKKRIRFTKRKRKSTHEWIKNLSVDISERARHDKITCLAWRVAAKKWLEKK